MGWLANAIGRGSGNGRRGPGTTHPAKEGNAQREDVWARDSDLYTKLKEDKVKVRCHRTGVFPCTQQGSEQLSAATILLRTWRERMHN